MDKLFKLLRRGAIISFHEYKLHLSTEDEFEIFYHASRSTRGVCVLTTSQFSEAIYYLMENTDDE